MSLRFLITILLITTVVACTTVTPQELRQLKNQGDVEGLSKVLTSYDKQDRLSAIHALGNEGDPRAINALSKILQAESWTEREAAVIAIGQINDILSVNPLIEALHDPERFVRERAAEQLNQVAGSLGVRKNTRVVQLLLEAQRSDDTYTREQTAVALMSAVQKLRSLTDPQFVDSLISKLNDENRYVRRQAATALSQIDDPRAIQPLIQLQSDNDLLIREIASQAIQEVDDPRSISALIKVLNTDDEFLRKDTINKLSEFRAADEVTQIESALKNSNAAIRAGVANVLGNIKSPTSVVPLEALLTDKQASVRLAAANALKVLEWGSDKPEHLGLMCVAAQAWPDCIALGEPAITPLVNILLDSDQEVRSKAADTLLTMNWQPTSQEDKGIYCVMKREWENCVALGEYALTPLIAELEFSEADIQANIIDTLIKINHPRAIEPLVNLLANADSARRRVIINALSEFNHPLAVKTLIQSLDDNNYYVRQDAATALEHSVAKFGSNNYFDIKTPILHALKDNNRNVRIVAARLIGALNDPTTIPQLLIALDDSDHDVRDAAADSLNRIDKPEAITYLVTALQNPDPQVRKHIVISLSLFKDSRALESLLSALSDPNIEVQTVAIDVLGKIDDPQVIQPLIQKLETNDIEVKHHTILALGNKDDPRVIAALKPLLSHKDAEIRTTAGEILVKKNWQPKTLADKGFECVIKHDWNLCESLKEHAVEPLILELQDANSNIRVESARTLGYIQDIRAITPLITSIELTQWTPDDNNDEIIKSAQKALIRYGRDALPELINYLTDWYTSHYLVEVLESIHWIPRTDVQLVHYQIARRAKDEIIRNWALAKTVLLTDINEGNEQRRNNAIFTLIGLGNNELMPQLLSTLKSQGSVTLAEAYLNSYNDALEAAAVRWATDNNLEVKKFGKGNSPVRWGTL